MKMGTTAAALVGGACLAFGGFGFAQEDTAVGIPADQTIQVTARPAHLLGQTYTAVAGQSGKAQVPAALNKKITKRFSNVNLSEVLAWLSLQDLSFVADMGAFPDRKVTMNFVGQPLNKVMDTIAETMGGTWQRRGDIYTLSPKAGAFRNFGGTFVVPGQAGGFKVAVPDGKSFKLGGTASPFVKLDVKELDGKNWVFAGDAQKELQKARELTPAQKKEIEKALAEAKTELKRAIEELQKHKGELKGMNDEQLQQLMKQLNEIVGKNLPQMFQSMPFGDKGQVFRFDGDALKKLGEMKGNVELKGLLEKSQAMREQALGERMKVLEKLDIEKTVDKSMAERMKALEKLQLDKMDEKQLQRLKELKVPEGARVYRLGGSQRFGDLIKSLSSEQKAKMEKQGFLTPADLTGPQREMLGQMPEGHWEITFVQNGEKITIKGGG